MNKGPWIQWSAAGAGLLLAAGCGEELDGPPPQVAGVEPRLLCSEQIETTVTIDGSALSPTVFDSLTEDERAILPKIGLTRSTDLEGSSVDGSLLWIPDSEAEGQVRWTSDTEMDFDVTPDLGLDPGVYDITIENPSEKQDRLEQAIGAVPRPVIDEIVPEAMCVAQSAQSFEIHGSGFLSVEGELPDVEVNGNTYTADATDSCTELAVPGGGVESCATVVATIPEGDLEPGTYEVVVRNPAPAQCASSDEASLEITPPPELTAVNPDSAPEDTAVDVTLTGADFQEGMSITLDASPQVEAEGVVVESDTEASATFDLEGVSPGTYDVTVSNPDGCSFTREQAFTVVSPVTFDIAGINPPFGCTCEQTTVTITSDDGFVSTPRVELEPSEGDGDKVQLESTAFISPDTITAVVPEGAPLGTYDVTVINPPSDGGLGTLEEAYRVVSEPVPSIEAIVPARGEPGTQTAVSIFGENFRDPVRVELIDRNGDIALNAGETTPVDGTQIDTTFDLEGIAEDIYLVRVTNLDQDTFSDFSNFQVASIGPSGNLAEFESAAPLNTGRRMLATASAQDPLGNQHLYAIGGDEGAGAQILDSVENAQLSDFGNLGSWSDQGHFLDTARVGAASVSVPIIDPEVSEFIPVKTYLYVLGGLDENGNVLDSIERALVLDPNDAPDITSVSASAESGSLENGTWYYKVSAVMPEGDPDNPNGETLPSDEAIYTLSGDASAIDLEWNAVEVDGVQAESYRVYRTPAVDGVSQTEELLDENIQETSYTDTGGTAEGETPLPPGSTGVWQPVEGQTLAVPRWGHQAALLDDGDPTNQRYIHVLGGRSAPKGAADAGYLDSVEFSAVGRDDGLLATEGFSADTTTALNAPLAFFSLAVETAENVSGFDGFARLFVFGGVNDNAGDGGNQAQKLLEFSDVAADDGTNGAWNEYSGTVQDDARRAGTMAVITTEKLFAMGGAKDVQNDLDFGSIQERGLDVGFEDDGTLVGDAGGGLQDTGEDMIDSRALGRVLFQNGFLFFIGGTSDGEDALNTVERTF